MISVTPEWGTMSGFLLSEDLWKMGRIFWRAKTPLKLYSKIVHNNTINNLFKLGS